MAQGAALPPQVQHARLQQAAKSGASWFYWIAGLSAVNSLAWWLQLDWTFAVGLGFTQLVDGVASNFGTIGVAVAIVLDAVTVALFVLVGRLALRHRPVYVVGIVVYTLDALLTLAFGVYFAAGFHLFALFFLVSGLRAARTLAIAQPGQDLLAPEMSVPVHPTLAPLLREPALAEEVQYFGEE